MSANTTPKNATYIIERNVPLPPPVARLGRDIGPLGRLLRAMEVGDSAFLAGRKLNVAYSYGKASGKKFTARSVTERGEAGVRIWRTE